MQDLRFSISSDDCEILLEFEKQPSLAELSNALAKDISVVSRYLKSIAEKSDVIEKKGGRWVLTDKGRELNQLTREQILAQKLILNKQQHIKIATTREFAARVLLPQTRSLVGDENITISFLSTHDDTEKLIASGKADIGFYCGRPEDPLVAHKKVAKESFVTVAAPKFVKRYKIKTYEDVKEHDQLKFSPNSFTILDLAVESKHYFGTFSDISTLRNACLLGYGWAVVPYYTVKEEIDAKKLIVIPGLNIESMWYCVWWQRDRKSLKKWVDKSVQWLRGQKHRLHYE